MVGSVARLLLDPSLGNIRIQARKSPKEPSPPGEAEEKAEQNMQSTVIGHVHSFAGIQYSANSRHLIFGFNVGCLIDKDAYAFEYAKKIKRKPILGCGIVINGVPTFIPMLLDKKGRWIGKL